MIVQPIKIGQPETIPGLSWDSPNFSESGHKIVRTFRIDRRQRPKRDNIPCAICCSHPKFLDGAVIWSPDKWLRVVGHVCAAKPEHFGVSTYRNLQRERNQEERDWVALTWVYENRHIFSALRTTIEGLTKVAEFLEAQQKLFYSGVPELAEFLNNIVHRQGSLLTVVEERSAKRMEEDEVSLGMVPNRYETVTLGHVKGGAFLVRPNISRSRQLTGVIQAFDRIPAGDPESSMSALMDQGEAEVTITAITVLNSIKRAQKIAMQITDAKIFLGNENLEVLRRFGKDHRTSIQFSIDKKDDKIRFIAEDRSRAALSSNWPLTDETEGPTLAVTNSMSIDKILSRRSAN